MLALVLQARTCTSVLISVLTPTRNRATTFLGDAVASVSSQVLPPGFEVEHVIADDGSISEEWEALRSLVSGDSRVCLVRRDTSTGVSGARNAAFRASQGEIIVDLDDDDILPSTSLADRTRHLLESGHLWSCGDMLKLDESLAYKVGADLAKRVDFPQTVAQAMRGFLAGELYAWAGTRTYYRSAIEDAGPWDETFPVAEDLEHWMRLTATCGQPSWCERWLVLYREKERSLGIDALRDGSMADCAARARARWSQWVPGKPLPDGLPRW